MTSFPTRKIVIAGVMSAIAIFLGATRLGFIPWFTGTSITIMAIPVIIGAVLEGPVVGMATGLLFGLFSLLQAAIAPTGPGDVIFTNPLIFFRQTPWFCLPMLFGFTFFFFNFLFGFSVLFFKVFS